MGTGLKVMFPRDLLKNLLKRLGMKLENLVALGAIKMIVVRVAVVVLVPFAVSEPLFSKQSGFDEQVKRAVDRGPARYVLSFQIICRKMFMEAEDIAHQTPAALREPLTAHCEEFAEFLFGLFRNSHFWQR